MAEKMYFHLFILYTILCQGIIGTLSAGDISGSLNFLVREKRVINHEPGEHLTSLMVDVPYVVNIRQHGRSHCVGSILSRLNAVTAAHCLEFHKTAYEVFSGSSYVHRAIVHNITAKIAHYGNPPYGRFEGISMITVNPPFTLSPSTTVINLHVGPIPAGTQATVSGWGASCGKLLPPMEPRRRLRTITLPVIGLRVCQQAYRGRFDITNKHICTYDTQKACARHDAGTPLVVDGKLAGIYIWKGEIVGLENPDVFQNIQHQEYNTWIRENIHQ